MSSIQYQRKELEKVYLLNLKDSSLEKLKNDSDQMKIRYLQRKIRSQNEIFDINWNGRAVFMYSDQTGRCLLYC